MIALKSVEGRGDEWRRGKSDEGGVSSGTETRNHVRLRRVRFRVSGFGFRSSDFVLQEETEITEMN